MVSNIKGYMHMHQPPKPQHQHDSVKVEMIGLMHHKNGR